MFFIPSVREQNHAPFGEPPCACLPVGRGFFEGRPYLRAEAPRLPARSRFGEGRVRTWGGPPPLRNLIRYALCPMRYLRSPIFFKIPFSSSLASGLMPPTGGIPTPASMPIRLSASLITTGKVPRSKANRSGANRN